jgi:hypothetical protein
MPELSNLRLAVLIDADNAPRTHIKSIMEEVARYGTPTVKRIYGDWTTPNMASWKNSLLENAIIPIQQYSYTTGKNSTDSAMIIDAMDILYGGSVDGFVLVSSDSDFTRLALRLREAGMKVLGIGEKKTPGPFIAACDKFVYIDILAAEKAEAAGEKQTKQSKKTAKPQKPKVPDSVVALIAASVSDLADEDGCVFMGDLGNMLLKKSPDFDCRNFGFRSLSAMIRSISRFQVDFRQTTDPNIKHPYVSDKESI